MWDLVSQFGIGGLVVALQLAIVLKLNRYLDE